MKFTSDWNHHQGKLLFGIQSTQQHELLGNLLRKPDLHSLQDILRIKIPWQLHNGVRGGNHSNMFVPRLPTSTNLFFSILFSSPSCFLSHFDRWSLKLSHRHDLEDHVTSWDQPLMSIDTSQVFLIELRIPFICMVSLRTPITESNIESYTFTRSSTTWQMILVGVVTFWQFSATKLCRGGRSWLHRDLGFVVREFGTDVIFAKHLAFCLAPVRSGGVWVVGFFLLDLMILDVWK